MIFSVQYSPIIGKIMGELPVLGYVDGLEMTDCEVNMLQISCSSAF